jgi:hypothetical protein
LAAWRFCFLGQPQRTMERISSALHFLGSDSGDRDQRDIVDHERLSASLTSPSAMTDV